MLTVAVIECPDCGHRVAETMPIDACQRRYRCVGCGSMLRPRDGDCCVYCSYADTPCPPMQTENQ